MPVIDDLIFEPPKSHLTLHRPTRKLRKTVVPPKLSSLKRELKIPHPIQDKKELINVKATVLKTNGDSAKSPLFPGSSAYPISNYISSKLPTEEYENGNDFVSSELESISRSDSKVSQTLNTVRYCEGIMEVRVDSSRFQCERFIQVYSNKLLIYKSSSVREIVFTIKLDKSTSIQRSKKFAHGISVYHYDDNLGTPLFCTIIAKDKVNQNDWIRSIASAKQTTDSF